MSKYGRWVTLGEPFNKLNSKGNYVAYQTCRCVCGQVRDVLQDNLIYGRSRSCGCFNRDGKHRITHGKSNSPEYMAWRSCRERCNNPNIPGYRNYGGRGITICDRWLNSFENFYADMGPRPSPKHSLDRIDNDGNYEPGNCRWATTKQQSRNRRNNIIVTYDGDDMCLRDFANLVGKNPNLLTKRVKKGAASIVEAASEPTRERFRFLTYNGVTRNVTEWARHIGITSDALLQRLHKLKWDLGKALSTPRCIRTKYFTYKGKTQTINDWAVETGIPKSALWARLGRGWDFEKAIKTPSISRGKNKSQC
jgi:hypothetical protein